MGNAVDQNTALQVDHTGQGLVIGAAGVTICRVDQAKVQNISNSLIIENVRCSYATSYDTIDLSSGDVTFSSSKQPLAGYEGPDAPISSTDIFNSPDNPNVNVTNKQFVQVAQSLFNSTATTSLSYTWETTPQAYVIHMEKDSQSVGYAGEILGQVYISYKDLIINIYPTWYTP